MFTTGSKLLIGATTLSVVGAVVYANCTDGPDGFMGTIGLIFAAIVFAFLVGVNYFIHDGTVPSMQQGAQSSAAAAQAPAAPSIWPLVAALGVAGMVVGAVSKPVVFEVAVVVLLAAIIEWMVQGWSERASGDVAYNADVRKRMLHPLEFPVLAAIALAVVVYAFSRLMLNISEGASRVVFIAIAALVLAAAFVLANRRRAS
jgi:hypothetical protein